MDTPHNVSLTNPNKLKRRGLLFVLSSPSGAGKSTIAQMLLKSDPELKLSVSYTTRAPRRGEIDGTHYHFTDEATFKQMIEDDLFMEWAVVFDHYYGTPKAQVRAGLKEGEDYLFDIDWQGTQQLYQRNETDVVRVFILPPSMKELDARLRKRATDSEEVIEARMARSKAEISHWDGYDYVVINDDVDRCFNRVREILHAERVRRSRQTGLVDFVRDLMA